MSKEESLEILKEGVSVWNAAKIVNKSQSDPFVSLSFADLSGMDLRGVDFSGVELHGADLSDADLTGANLEGTGFAYASLHRAKLANARIVKPYSKCTDYRQTEIENADFSGSELSGANFGSAILRNVSFHSALLIGVNFSFAEILHTDFTKAAMTSNVFADNDLSGAVGLETIKCFGPSTIGIDTIYKSNGKIPAHFLRSCGVPEGFITQMNSLVNAEDGLQFYSSFISYSSKDEDFSEYLHTRLTDARLRVWFAPEDIRGGQKLHDQIEEAINIHDKLLIVLSEASLKSEWVTTEIRHARSAERRSGKRKLFPVRLVDMETLRTWKCFDSDEGKDLAVELREYFIPNFQNWKDPATFEKAFSRLLEDLRSNE